MENYSEIDREECIAKFTLKNASIIILENLTEGKFAIAGSDGKVKICSKSANSSNITMLSEITAHANEQIVCMLGLSDGHLVTSSLNNSVKFWDNVVGELSNVTEFLSEFGNVNNLIRLPNGGIVGSTDKGYIMIWAVKNANEFVLAFALQVAWEEVSQILVLSETRLLVACKGKLYILKKLFKNSYEIICECVAHENSDIKALLIICDDFFASASDDGTISIWRETEVEDNYILNETLYSHKEPVKSLIKLDSQKFASASMNKIYIWKLNSDAIAICIFTLEAVNTADKIPLLKVPSGLIFANNSEIMFLQESEHDRFDIKAILNRHEDNAIFSLLVLPDEGVVSAAKDNFVMLWSKPGTGKIKSKKDCCVCQ
jgi:WD40 repeat protein